MVLEESVLFLEALPRIQTSNFKKYIEVKMTFVKAIEGMGD